MNPDVATPEYIDDMVAQVWFQERVFDMYLWHLGADAQQALHPAAP